MDRRAVLKLGAGFSAAVLLARQALSAGRAAASEVMALDKLPLAASTPFADDTVIEQARLLAKSPYLPPQDTVSQSYKDLNYDRYRAIRFKKSLALWSGDNLGYTAELFSAGYIYQTPVRIFVVDGAQAAEIAYDPDIFTYGPEVSRPPEGSRPGFSGLRIHAPIDKAERNGRVRGVSGRELLPRQGGRAGLRHVRRGGLRSTPPSRPRTNSRFSGATGSKGRRRARQRSRFSPCSIARAFPELTNL